MSCRIITLSAISKMNAKRVIQNTRRSSLGCNDETLVRLRLLLCKGCLHAEHDEAHMVSEYGQAVSHTIGQFDLAGCSSTQWTMMREYMTWRRVCCESSSPKNLVVSRDHAVRSCVSCRFPSMPTKGLRTDWQEIRMRMDYHTCLAGFVSMAQPTIDN